MKESTYNEKLKALADQYVHEVYAISKSFPKDEQYGSTSQLRRAALSVVLNIVEGYTRRSEKDYQHFIEIAFGSLKESMYLLRFAVKEMYVTEVRIQKAEKAGEELGAMLWGILKHRSR